MGLRQYRHFIGRAGLHRENGKPTRNAFKSYNSIEREKVLHQLTRERCQELEREVARLRKVPKRRPLEIQIERQVKELQEALQAQQRELSENFDGVEETLSSLIERVTERLAFVDALKSEFKLANFTAVMMRTLLFDLLDLAQVERGTFRVFNDYFDLTTVLRNAFNLLQHQASQKSIKLETLF